MPARAADRLPARVDAEGRAVTLRVTARPRAVGLIDNIVATNTSTNELNTDDNRADAKLVVRRNTRPRFTG